MKSPEMKQTEEDTNLPEEHSLRNALLTSILFVGGGIVFFWLLLFITYSSRL